MSKPMEQGSFSVTIPGKTNQGNQGSPQVPRPNAKKNDDLSMKHIAIAFGVFAMMVALFGYGFYVQQRGVTATEPETKIVETAAIPQPATSSGLSDASAHAAVSSLTVAAAARDEPVAASGLIESLHADIYFDFGKARLRADAIETLQQQAQILKQDGNWAVLIQGYADRHGSMDYNKMLALRRGESVKQFLTELGIPSESMKVVSLGQDASLCDDPTPICKRLNRRVHLELVKLQSSAASLAPIAPLATVPTTHESERSPTTANVESASDQNHEADLQPGPVPGEDAEHATIPSAELQ